MEKQIIEIEGKKYEVTLVPVEEVEQKTLSGFYVDTSSVVRRALNVKYTEFDLNIFRTKEQAEACLAMAQLSQLIFEANKGWEPNWEDSCQEKSVIYFNENKIRKGSFFASNEFLSFKNDKIRDKFLEENEQLILTAQPLL